MVTHSANQEVVISGHRVFQLEEISEAGKTKVKVSHLKIHFWTAVVMGRGYPVSQSFQCYSYKLFACFSFCERVPATSSNECKDTFFLLRGTHQWG